MTTSTALTDELPKAGDYGDCPDCGGNDGYVNVGCNHWFLCHEHQSKWWVGSNLFSCWREDSRCLHAWNKKMLANYTEVEPWDRIPRKPFPVFASDPPKALGWLNADDPF